MRQLILILILVNLGIYSSSNDFLKFIESSTDIVPLEANEKDIVSGTWDNIKKCLKDIKPIYDDVIQLLADIPSRDQEKIEADLEKINKDSYQFTEDCSHIIMKFGGPWDNIKKCLADIKPIYDAVIQLLVDIPSRDQEKIEADLERISNYSDKFMEDCSNIF